MTAVLKGGGVFATGLPAPGSRAFTKKRRKSTNAHTLAYILVMAAATDLIRMLPLTLIRGQIRSPFIRSFLYYVPYVTLSVMTFPAILTATSSIWSGAAALAAAVLLAYRGRSLFQVSLAACAVVFVLELFLC